MNGPLKLLAIFPHPDDESLGLGSTLARYSAEGVETYLVCATRGERGWHESQGPDPGFEGVARIREAELRCAAENLGLHQVNFLDYIDGDETVWERDPVERLARAGEMMGFKHYGFWSCMDTLKEKSYLEELWNSGKAPWTVW